ncbi:MAG: ribonuclease HI family protein, partial [Patescibacteria group bacterium]
MQDNLFGDKKLIIYTDGGARGNPGPAAIGVVVGGKKYGETIGEATNNVAEYKAVIFALKKAKALLGKSKAKETEVLVNLDSELVFKQLRGEYKVLDENMQPLFIEVWNLKQDFKKVEFKHIPREQNKEADKMVNKALDNL